MMRPDAKVEKVYLYPKPVDFRKSIDLAALVELGCDSVQGYLTGRPLAPEQVQMLIARQAAPPSGDRGETQAE